MYVKFKIHLYGIYNAFGLEEMTFLLILRQVNVFISEKEKLCIKVRRKELNKLKCGEVNNQPHM